MEHDASAARDAVDLGPGIFHERECHYEGQSGLLQPCDGCQEEGEVAVDEGQARREAVLLLVFLLSPLLCGQIVFVKRDFSQFCSKK